MSVYLYEEAIIEKLRKVTGDGRISIVDPSQSLSMIAQLSKDKVKYPAIVLQRGPVSIVGETKNQAAMLKGQSTRINSDDSTMTKTKLIPIRIEWSIDVYAVDRYTCDEIIRELVFFFTTHPRFVVKVPYGLDIYQNFDLMLDDNIEDNSDLVDFPNIGESFRETLNIYTENAHFYSSSRQYLVQATSDVETINKEKIIKGDEE